MPYADFEAGGDTELDPYIFEDLKDGKYIRVLHLKPANEPSEALTGSLVQTDLNDDNSESYEALSWCWGSQGLEDILRIEVKRTTYQMKITKNLASALRCLRHKTNWRTLWVDAICINQDDLSERNHQVSMMNLVYGKTVNVCVWLDDNKPTGKDGHFDADIAFKFIRDSILDLWHFDKVCDEEKNSPQWVALVHLMTKPWFSRRWVIQEIALAPRATLHCGEHQMDWRDFADAVSLFVEAESATHRLSEVVKSDRRFNHIQGLFADVHTMGATLLVEMTNNLFRLTKEGVRKPLSTLEHLVSRLSMFDSSQVRDTIYALLAISKDAHPGGDSNRLMRLQHNEDIEELLQNEKYRGLSEKEKGEKLKVAGKAAALLASNFRFKAYEISYETKVVDVYKQFVEFCITQSRSLDIICRPWAPQDKVEQYSTSKLAGDHYGSDSGPDESNEEFAGPPAKRRKLEPVERQLPSWIADKRNTAFVLSRHDVTPVKMERRNADPFVGLPDRKIYHACGDLQVRRGMPQFRRRREYDQSLLVDGFVLDEVAEVKLPAIRGNIPAEWLELIEWDPKSKLRVPAEFCRTLVADRGSNGFNPPPCYERACTEAMRLMADLDGLDTLRTIHEKQCTIVAEFLRRVREVVFNRKMIRTKGKTDRNGNIIREGALGIAPNSVEPGDLICILYGCSVPVILRSVKKSEKARVREELADQKQFPKRLRKAVGVVRKRLLFWRHMKRAEDVWAREYPELAARRNARKGIAPDNNISDAAAPIDEASRENQNTFETPDRQYSSTNPTPLETRTNAMMSSPEGVSRSSRGTQTGEDDGSKTTAAKIIERETNDQEFLESYNKMCKEWADLIKKGKQKGRSRKYPNQDTPIEAPKPLSYDYCETYYKVIGECYIDEMMEGEALEVRTNEGIEDKDFELR